MPYKRKRSGYVARKKTYKRKRAYKGRSTAVRSNIWKKRPRASFRGGGGGQAKFADVPMTLVSLNNTTSNTGTLLNGLIPGTGVTQRIGRKIRMTSLSIQLGVQPNNGSTSTVSLPADYVRILLVYDRQSNSTPPMFSDVIQGSTSAATPAVSNAPWDGKNVNNRDRFAVLIDKHIEIPDTTGSGINAVGPYMTAKEMQLNRWINLKGLETIYNGDTAGYASIATGALWLFCQDNYASGSSTYATQFTARLTFKD